MANQSCARNLHARFRFTLLTLFAVGSLTVSAQAQPSTQPTRFNFDLSPATVPDKTHVAPDMSFSTERGFGFEPGADLKTSPSGISSDRPFFFHVAVPDGNYKVSVTFGDAQSASDNTVFAELRRLMIERLKTSPGEKQTRSFIVNVRTPTIAGGGEVRLGGREKTSEKWAWDERLSLQFNGAHPAISAIAVEKVDVPTVYLLGDSTVCDQPLEPFNSWGQMLTRFLKPDVAVANGAESGDSIAPSLGARRFDKFWGQMKPGDYLLIQYGHNDMKSNAPNALQTYANNMRRAVDETRQHGGTPVLITSVSRRTFDPNGKITNSFGLYTDTVRAVAEEKKCALIDLQASSARFYEALGDQKSHQAFATPAENTHHNNYGSYEVAKCVLMGIKQAKLDLANHIVDDFKDFDPSHPDAPEEFQLPKSPTATNVTPLGN